jgi:hypothetical protein
MDTVRRIIGQLHPDGLAALLRPADAARARPVRLVADGKSARGSRTPTRTAAHLLAVIDQDDQVIAQLRVPDKTNEIPCLREVLGSLDIEGAWVSADALHTQADTARFLVQDKKAHYLLTVKRNQPTLYASCRDLPWETPRRPLHQTDLRAWCPNEQPESANERRDHVFTPGKAFPNGGQKD